MNILIKDIDMVIPKHCLDCPFRDEEDNCIVQSVEANTSSDDWDGLKAGCPLVPAGDNVDVSGVTRQAVELIVEEHRRQIAEWGAQSGIPLFEFMSILGEEYGELCQAVNETLFSNPKHPERGGRDAIICEAVQVAAVAAQIIEAVLADGQHREDGDKV